MSVNHRASPVPHSATSPTSSGRPSRTTPPATPRPSSSGDDIAALLLDVGAELLSASSPRCHSSAADTIGPPCAPDIVMHDFVTGLVQLNRDYCKVSQFNSALLVFGCVIFSWRGPRAIFYSRTGGTVAPCDSAKASFWIRFYRSLAFLCLFDFFLYMVTVWPCSMIVAVPVLIG
jgi:hypothetical protein